MKYEVMKLIRAQLKVAKQLIIHHGSSSKASGVPFGGGESLNWL